MLKRLVADTHGLAALSPPTTGGRPSNTLWKASAKLKTRNTLPLILVLMMIPVMAGAQSTSDSPAESSAESSGNAPTLTGFWQLNPSLSDDLQEIMREALGGGPRGGRKGRHGGGGRNPDEGGHDVGNLSGSDKDQAEQMKKHAQEFQQQFSTLEIYQDGIELNVTNGLDITRLLYTDGRTQTIWTQRGEATATATWQDHTLVVHWRTEKDPTGRTRRYQLQEDGKRLNVTEVLRLPGQKDTVSISLIYDISP